MAITTLRPERIEQARLAADMSRADLAFELRRRLPRGQRGSNPDAGSVRRWERGETRPVDGVVVAIAAATDRPLEFFYGEGDDEEASRTW